MRKFLLSIFCCLSAVMLFGSSKYDTIFIRPNVEFNYALVVDTLAHPALSGENYNKVPWYLGYDNPKYIDNTTIVGEELENVITLGGNKSVHLDKVTDNTHLNGFIFYGYKVDLNTKSIDDNLLTLSKAKELTCDTVAYFHVLNTLNESGFKKFTLNGNASDLVVNEGDSVEFVIEYDDAIDVQEYHVVSLSEDMKDTIIIASSTENRFKVPMKAMETTGVYPMVSNEISKSIKMGTYKKNLTVRPVFEINSASVSVTSGDKTSVEIFNDLDNIEAEILNHDSVALTVSTNVLESKVNYITNWTLNNEQLTNDSIYCSEDGLVLYIPEFKKPDMDGSFKCTILKSDNGAFLGEVVFKVISSYPTGNIEISKDKSVTVANNTLYSNDFNGLVYLYSVNGKLINSFNINKNSNVSLNLPKGIYFVKFGHNALKFMND